MTLSSRILGMVRDIVFASVFGTSGGLDAFFVAFKIPNFFRRLFAEGAFSQAFVPVLTEYQLTQDHPTVQRFIRHVTGNLLLVLALLIILVIAMAPWVVLVFAPGFIKHPHLWEKASHWLRITFSYLGLIAYTALGSAILNTRGRFTVAAFIPVLLNIVLITMAIWGTYWFEDPITALAVGVLLAGVLQSLSQWPSLHKLNLSLIPQPCWQDPGVKRVLILIIPALLGASVAQLGILIDMLFASFLPSGSISWLYYSDRLTFFPLGVFGVALATVILPHLSRKTLSALQFNHTLDWAFCYIGTIGIPACIGLMTLSGPLLCTLFFRGAFTVTDILMTQQSLFTFALGVPAFMMMKVLIASYYARQDMRSPMHIAVIAVLINVGLNALFVGPLHHAGLALATTLASWVNVLLLFKLLKRRKLFQSQCYWRGLLSQWFCANSAMMIFLEFMHQPLGTWIQWTLGQRIFHLSILVGGGAMCYGLVLVLCGFNLSRLYAPTNVE